MDATDQHFWAPPLDREYTTEVPNAAWIHPVVIYRSACAFRLQSRTFAAVSIGI